MIITPLILIGGIFGTLLLCYVTVVFLISRLTSDNSIMDVFYGPAFAVTAWLTIWMSGLWSLGAIVGASLVTVWAARLAIRIGRKNLGQPEDARYAKWRQAWCAHGTLYFTLRSYLQINLLQGIIIAIVSLPLIILITAQIDTLTPLMWLGATVFALGLLYETIADWQLDTFLARKRAGTEEATLMTQGLFAYSRRPNYFGESVIWWGLAILAFSTLPLGWLAFLSPLCITYILTKVTGPMLEAQFLDRYPDEYSAYMASTNYFVPGKKKGV